MPAPSSIAGPRLTSRHRSRSALPAAGTMVSWALIEEMFTIAARDPEIMREGVGGGESGSKRA
jgi:hypothetical protein